MKDYKPLGNYIRAVCSIYKTMNIKLLKSEPDYQLALSRLAEIIDAVNK